ncbi:MAG: NADH-quinone oxidoreductase subunit N, partial [Desulfomonile sp.]|nr:NADH-quinone oxidoreductase subunit N [Desulfomonile sp.]
MIPIPDINMASILPALILCVAGVVILLVGMFVRTGMLTTASVISLFGIALGFMTNTPLRRLNQTAFAGLVAMDAFSWFLNIMILIAAGLTVLISLRYLADEGMDLYEYFVLILFASAGMMFMVSANHILVLFIGLETLSISIYVLVGLRPGNAESKEAALKYLLLGAFSSGIFLYGAALLYGSASSLSLPALAKHLQAGQASLMAKAGMGLLLVGFCFKIAAVPFHMWTPDVYEGAPAPLTAYMSVGVKAAAFAAFVRVFFDALSALQLNWSLILWVLAALTMIVGNIAALVQENIKRMLAYSSIAHAGYILVGMVAGQEAGTSSMIYYLFAYTFTNI